MDKNKALQNLLRGKATKKEIELLKQALASGEISVGGDMNRSVVIIGSGNKVELTSEALNLLKPETKTDDPVEGEPPYMGLRYFDISDEDLFYGREALTAELLRRVKNESFLAIVGASGSGKSSVARAGLIPAWTKENERGVIHITTPTAHPLESLAASLTRESESVTATSTLMDDLKHDSRSLRLYIRKTHSASGKSSTLLLVDQFEETFTLCKDTDERKAFIENLLTLADDDGAARVVITLRADFYHHCAEYEGLRQALKTHQEYIGAMTTDELRQAITTPAEKNGWKFQDSLVEQIVQDVGSEPGALPLLSHALLETWKHRQGHTLTLQGYHEAGGVKKAIAQTAESVYDKLTYAEQTIARGIFLRLTELGEGVQDTRRRVKMDELVQTKEQDAVSKVLKTLTDARLVMMEQDSAEVAHEALIREWGTLRKWLDEDRESLRLHRHLTESAHEWERRGKEASELYRGARLKQIQEWLKEHKEQLSQLESEFIKVSQNFKRQEYFRWTIVAFAVFDLLLLAVLGVTGRLNHIVYRPVDMEDYWVTIPAGDFLMGSSDEQIADALKTCFNNCNFSDEQPQYLVYLDAYQIGKYEVTNIQYFQCVKSSVCVGSAFGTGMDFHPVISVTWYDAQTYCKWVGGRLPTEAEWEKAARGTDGRTYPWGNNIDCKYANYGDCEGNTTEVGSYQSGKSTYGVYDMAGNIWEWTSSLHYDYPYVATDGREDLNNPYFRVLRGGYWRFGDYNVRSAVRGYTNPTEIRDSVGFRCARDIVP